MNGTAIIIDDSSNKSGHDIGITRGRIWFDDGSIIIKVDKTGFRMHREVLQQHSSTIMDILIPLETRLGSTPEHSDVHTIDGCPIYEIPAAKVVSSEDFEALLVAIYPEARVADSPYSHSDISRLLRVSAPNALNFPEIFSQMERRFMSMYPVFDPVAVDHERWLTGNLEDALEVAKLLQSQELQKEFYYAIATTSDIDFDDMAEEGQADEPEVEIAHDPTSPIENPDPVTSTSNSPVNPITNLSRKDTQRCISLIQHISSSFTPTLFQPASALHMDCTDALAGAWMTFVVTSAISGGDVLRPLEALKRIREIEWEAEGVCRECVESKRREWEEEARTIWGRMDGWLDGDSR